MPSKISALGIELQGADQQALLATVAFVILYFLLAFMIYAASDFLAWWLSITSQAIEIDVSSYEGNLRGHSPQPGTIQGELENRRAELYKKIRIHFKLVTPLSIVRALFDFCLPIAVGGHAIIILFIAASGDSI